MPQWANLISFSREKEMQYVCEIPWDQIWDEYNGWYESLSKNGLDSHLAPSWEDQQKKFRQIANETIPFRLRWKKQVWQPFMEWHNSHWLANSVNPDWKDQMAKIQQLVQEEADYSVNQ